MDRILTRDALQHPAMRLLVLAAIILLAYFKWLPLPWRQPVVAAIALGYVIASGERLAQVGFLWPAAVRQTIFWALLGALVSCAFITPVLEPMLNRAAGTPADYSGYGALVGNLDASLKLLRNAWISAAIGEEVIFRGFLMHQLIAVFGNGRWQGGIAALCSALVFGLSHHTQGATGMILTGLTGLLMAAIFLRSGRNLWAVILAHGLIDTFGVMSLYYNWY